MKQIALFAVAFAVFAVGSPVASFANGSGSITARPSEIATPVVDVFEDGDCRLRLVAIPSADLSIMQVTLVYEDRALRTIRSVTVNPDVVAKSADSNFNSFLAGMDTDFVSYVRATLADRLLHLSTTATALDRAESAIFFRTTDLDPRTARRVSATEPAAE